ncbi:MAG: SLOG family protein [Candidatus Ornithomonoglobus sp.]
MKIKTVCFTGHRMIKLTAHLRLRLYNTLEALIKQGTTDFYTGGALGWDSLCAQVVVELRRQYHNITLNLILPCSEEEQTAKWNDEQKQVYYEILSLADSVEYVSDHYWNGCMKKRNARLVECADYCVCYYDKRKSTSGTGQTVRMAQRKGIEIINLAE